MPLVIHMAMPLVLCRFAEGTQAGLNTCGTGLMQSIGEGSAQMKVLRDFMESMKLWMSVPCQERVCMHGPDCSWITIFRLAFITRYAMCVLICPVEVR